MDRTDDSGDSADTPPTVRTVPGASKAACLAGHPIQQLKATDVLALKLEPPRPLAAALYLKELLGAEHETAPVRISPPGPLRPASYITATAPLAHGDAVVEEINNEIAPPAASIHAPEPINERPNTILAPNVQNTLAPTVVSLATAQIVLPSVAAVLPPSLQQAVARVDAAFELPHTPSVEIAVAPELPPQDTQAASAGAPEINALQSPLTDVSQEISLDPYAAPMALVRRVARFVTLAVGAWFAAILILLILFRFVDPPTSSRMLQKRIVGADVVQTWVSLENISPQVVRAVLLSEDGRFCQHYGVDFEEMLAAISRARDGIPRGASTISMQVIKNLFLWPSKSFLRKAIEIPLTFAMELLWPKRRIMEVYLNIAEWGPGIFGVEAASQFHFDKSASRLNERDAAQLAVALPNPYIRDAGDPGPKTQHLAEDIQGRMRRSSPSDTACVARAAKPKAR